MKYIKLTANVESKAELFVKRDKIALMEYHPPAIKKAAFTSIQVIGHPDTLDVIETPEQIMEMIEG